NGAWVEAQVAWINASVGPGQIEELSDQQRTATATGFENGDDRFRLRIKNRLDNGPSSPHPTAQENVNRPEGWPESEARYASMNPGGMRDVVQFFVIARG